MFDALYIAATGMQAQQQSVDTVANNLANASTPGFKKARVSFTDLMTREVAQVADAGEAGPLQPLERLGSGVAVSGVTKVFDMGDVKQTGSPYDLAILGDGFLEVTMPDGGRAFTRGRTLTVNAEGKLATASGHPLRPGIDVPPGATGLSVDAGGRVLVAMPGRGGPVEAGRLELVRFANPGGLLAQGDGIYRTSEASGEPIAGSPGEEGLGALAQGYLEGSNVKMIDEMVTLMIAQRAYEASVKVVQASDEMLGLVNGLRK